MIIGTAGHIDHGKSALVEALTGGTVDRLAEERRRGITIDLNFAPLSLADGETVGIIDVPGHEDFVRTMVAGAAGIDMVLLVVAADEGLMPQTLEHLLIVEQLGVSRGIPVITKTDLVDPDWLDMVATDLAERLDRSPIAFEPWQVVSAKTGAGIEGLRETIERLAQLTIAAKAQDTFRMPIDRSFSLPGVGTVVTGTIWSGVVAVGDTVTLLPTRDTARIRSIEHYGKPTDRSRPRARAALGLAGLDRARAGRGSVAVTDDLPWRTTGVLDVDFTLHESAPRPLRSRARIRVHLGTAEVMARIYPHPPATLAPGDRSLARLALEEPLVARGGDRVVVRSYSPVVTIGGGRVLDPEPPRRRTLWPEELAAAAAEPRLEALIQRRPDGLHQTRLPLLLGVTPAEAEALTAQARGLVRAGDMWVRSASVEQCRARALSRIRTFHQEHPTELGVPLQTLKGNLGSPPWLADLVVAELAQAGVITSSDGRVRETGFRPTIPGGHRALDRLVEMVEAEGLAPPSVSELASRTDHPDLAGALRMAAREGRVVAIGKDRFFGAQALGDFVATLERAGSQGEITIGDLRDRLGLSRKFLIPLLEWADGQGMTVRQGDIRRWVARSSGPDP